MTGSLLRAPVFRAVDDNGLPMPGALLQFYATGTTTPANVYTSSALATPLTNPVVADSGGLFPPIYLDPTVTYRCQLLTGAASLVQDLDPVNGPPAIAAGSITAAELAAGVALSNLGFTPLNKAGDTATGLLIAAGGLAANAAGYLGAPVNEQDGGYVFAAADAGKMVRTTSTVATTYTIPPVSAVNWPLGAAIVIRNAGSAVLTVTRGSGVALYGAGTATNKGWALAGNGLATIVYEQASNQWVISGVGLS